MCVKLLATLLVISGALKDLKAVSQQGSNNLKVKEDATFCKVTPIGLNPYPNEAKDYAMACEEYTKMLTSLPTITKFTGQIRQGYDFTSIIYQYIKQKLSNPKSVCKTAKGQPEVYRVFAEKANNHFEKFKPIREKYVNAMSAAMDPKTNISKHTLGCLLNKWANETKQAISDDFVKNFLEKPLTNLGELTKHLKPTIDCNLSGYEPPTIPQKYNSIEILFYEAVKNVLKKEKGEEDKKKAAKKSTIPATITVTVPATIATSMITDKPTTVTAAASSDSPSTAPSAAPEGGDLAASSPL